MAEAERRVALLARAGVACDRLRSALGDAGANLVLVGDPTALEPDALDAADPDVVVVVLDPATEDALDRFENLLVDPSIEVIFEEAELTVSREGWDEARWARHLSAKLHRHDDVLPPGREPEPEPDPMLISTGFERPLAAGSPLAQEPVGFDPASAETSLDPLSFVAAEQIGELARVAPSPPPVEDDIEFLTAEAAIEDDAERLDIDEIVAEPLETEQFAATEELVAAEAVAADDFDLDHLTLEAVDSQDDVPGNAAPYSPTLEEWVEPAAAHADVPALDETGLGDLEVWRAPPQDQVRELIDFDSAFAIQDDKPVPGFESESAPTVAPLDFDDGRNERAAAEARSFESDFEFDLNEDLPAAPKAPLPPAPTVPDWSFSDEASLVSAATGQSGAHGNAGVGKHDLDEIERRISSLELVDDSQPVSTRNGAVLVLAGIGGPDAVRQLLGALPENFGRPVLVQQRLDGGRYDKLVAQMQRATSVLVKLAEAGTRTIDGVIYILPAGLGIEVGDSGIQFVEGGEVLDVLPASDSAVLLFSGADPAQVDTAMTLSAHGAMVAGQSPDGCYDAAAASAAIARGAGSGQPAELAAKLASRWSMQSAI
ncbi:chemotaxis protein CheB [Lysobacter sp. 1R34A]|uniref:chemotaxis protein CheB n=1 Tax=Lysobacter sp. 1R34A TaxID=3445786 RepID=UPI003EEBABD5